MKIVIKREDGLETELSFKAKGVSMVEFVYGRDKHPDGTPYIWCEPHLYSGK